MDMDSDIDAALIARAREATSRWEARTSIREARTEALRRNAPLEADTPARLAARLNNLIDDVRRSTEGRRAPDNPTLKSLVERPMPVTAEEVNEQIVQEVVIATRDFLSVEFLERGVVASRAVGRVLVRSQGSLRARGTGVLVAPGLLLTNEHVLTSAELAELCVLEMDYEQNRFGPAKQPQTFILEPGRLFLNDKQLDYALVAVSTKSDLGTAIDSYGWLPLNGAQGKISISDKDHVNIIQHPLGREKEVVVRNNRVLDMRTANDAAVKDLGPFLHYEADTEKGSSGSPVVNDGWELIGVHHAGVPATDRQGNWLDKDNNIWREGEQPVERIQWVANEALRVSSLVAAIAIAPLGDDKRNLLKALLSIQSPMSRGEASPCQESISKHHPENQDDRKPTTRAAEIRDKASVARGSGRSASIELPLRITVSIGEAPAATVLSPAPRPRLERAAVAIERLEPEDFADRDGYDRKFLGVNVPFPKVKPEPHFGGALAVPRPARPGDKEELRYHNYSVLMCGARRLAYISACNLDFGAPKTAGRKQGRNSWRTDPRLDPDQQLASRFYDHNDYDKGHLTRRDDTAWGDTLAEAIAANDDTFFYTNAAPQHYLLNQSDEFTGADLKLWGDLENHISTQGVAQRAKLSVFNGPIFGAKDKPLHDALVPLRFFKIVIWKDADQSPGAVGFVLSQSDLVATLPEEAIDPGDFEIRQHRIADIEAELDLSFGTVKRWDRLETISRSEAIDDAGILIRRSADIRL